MDFDQLFARIQVGLALEEAQAGESGMDDLLERQARRSAIRAHLAQMGSALQREITRLERLSPLPDLTCIRWAQHVLASSASRLLVLDTVFPAESATLVQVLLLDIRGQVQFHRCTATDVPLSPEDLTSLGVSPQDRKAAVSVPQMWPELRDALQGCYLLTADWRLARRVLEGEAQHASLEPLVLIGEDLLPWYARYYQESGMIGLASLCHLIGHPLPAHPTALEHARGQLALLQAMAQGITDAHSPETSPASFLAEGRKEDLL